MKNETPKIIKLSDYQKPNYKIETIELVINLDDSNTKVQSKMKIKKIKEGNYPIELNGEELILKSIAINDRKLSFDEYQIEDHLLIIKNAPSEFTLEIENLINPLANKTLDGLYKSGSIFCTQCEPEGFRKITYYLDRPDNMAQFKTTIIADKKLYPVLLSNGNPTARGDLENGKHFVSWEDPFKKPSYLYALVAGDLGMIKDYFKTASGREILLEIYCDKGNEEKCYFAMESLKKSMKWDEERFGLEYDLDIYMIVAVDAFNMGAMENKGLNIFNSAYVLANPKTATDANYFGIESVIAHEYFHNWTGNRVTCRDWFQLTLKEGLTVFRDQEFSADLNSKDVERINSVKDLRAHQFSADAGPMSHPIKPDSYIEINNFYTSTVYEKGAEVIRMIQTLLGVDGFRRGMDKYFELFDGQAVCTEDFLHAMSVANNNFDFSSFKNWYHQNGTPTVEAVSAYDQFTKEFKITFTQKLPPNTILNALPFHLPLNVGLVDKSGADILNKTLELKKEKEEFIFENINQRPIASINRGFSAPIKLISDLSFDDQLFLMAHDTDSFNRFEAAQVVGKKIINDLMVDVKLPSPLKVNQKFMDSFEKILSDNKIDNSYKTLLMTLPSEETFHLEQKEIMFSETKKACSWLKKHLANNFHQIFYKLYETNNTVGDYIYNRQATGERSLKNKCLYYLSLVDGDHYRDLAFLQFKSAMNMTDEIGALTVLVHADSIYKNQALTMFYDKWKKDVLVIQKWLAVQASNDCHKTIDTILNLEENPVYDETIPNFVRALWGQFVANKNQFNDISGKGYSLVAERILRIDKYNPSIAAGLTLGLKDYKRLPQDLMLLMKPELEKILATQGLSKNVFEIASKIL